MLNLAGLHATEHGLHHIVVRREITGSEVLGVRIALV